MFKEVTTQVSSDESGLRAYRIILSIHVSYAFLIYHKQCWTLHCTYVVCTCRLLFQYRPTLCH